MQSYLNADSVDFLNSNMGPLLLARRMPTTQKLVGEAQYAKLLRHYGKSRREGVSWPSFLAREARLNLPHWEEVARFEYALALSWEMQMTSLDCDVDGLVRALQDRPQDVHLMASEGAQAFSSPIPAAELWEMARHLSEENLAATYTQECSVLLGSDQEKGPNAYYLICTIQDNTEIHRVGRACHDSLRFLKEDSTSLDALVFEHFEELGPRDLEKVLRELITMGAIKDWAFAPRTSDQ